MVAAAAYFVMFAFGGGLQTDLATDAPPAWALAETEVMSGLIVLYVLAAGVFTVSLAVLQFHIGPWWVVLGGLCALTAGAGLLVVGSTASQSTYAVIDTFALLGFAGYMVATNVVGLRARRFNPVMVGIGVGAALLPLAATLVGGIVGGGLLALALTLYGVWAVWLGVAEWRLQRAGGTTRPAATQAALQ